MPQRQPLLEELDRYEPFDERERTMLESLRAFVKDNDACFERSLASGHVTGSAWIIDRSGRFALLAHHRKLERWLQPGGHADGNADPRSVAEREAREESGLSSLEPAHDGIYDVDVHEIPARGDEPAHAHYDVRFAFFGDPNEDPVVSDESHEVAWVKLTGIEELTIDDSIRRLVAKTESLSLER